MRQHFRYLSWFLLVLVLGPAIAAETVLYEKQSAYGPVIVSQDEQGMRILRFETGGARQSHIKPGDAGHIELPYARTAFTALALVSEPRRILVVGLGGGTLPMFLRKHYPDASIDAVDINPEVLYVARQYFGFQEDTLMRAHVDDGRAFIENSRQPYDMIFLDAYGSDRPPAHLTTLEFLQSVRKVLTPNGVVIGNLWGPGHNPQYDAMIRTYFATFDELYVLDSRGAGNVILLAVPRKYGLSRQDLARRARAVSHAKRLPFDLGELVDYGLQNSPVTTREGTLLRDAAIPR